MISMYKIKPKFQQLLKPLLDWLYRRGVTANQLTVAAILLSFGMGVSLWYADIWHYGYLVVPIGLLLRMALNALDGMMARIYNMQSKLGEVLNELGDVVSDMFIYIPLMKIRMLSTVTCCVHIFLIYNELSEPGYSCGAYCNLHYLEMELTLDAMHIRWPAVRFVEP